MDSINVEKIHALRKYKQQQFVNTLLFYPLVGLAFVVFCTSPFWFPSLYSSINTFLCVSIPRILSFFFNVKSLFILGNLIIVFLVRESKVKTSDSPFKDSNNNDQVKILPKKQEKTVSSNEVKMYAALPPVGKQAVSEKCLVKTYVDLSSNGKIDEVGFVNEKGRDTYFPPPQDETEKKAEKEVLWRDEGRRNNFNKDGGKVAVPALSTDELKRRADDFIARVNKQIRLEADEVLACAC